MDIQTLVAEQRKFFNSGSTRPLEFRQEALGKLAEAVRRHEADIADALKADLNKSPEESYITEISVFNDEMRYALRRLPAWVKNRRAGTPALFVPAKCYVVPEPYGVALIMSPWNYPFMLTLEPLIGALAAGNCAILKPSAYSPRTSALIAQIIAECFPPEYCAVVEGGRAVNSELLEQKFDYIFFTGSIAVGKMVMAAAAQHLTPVSLELGGKSPVIVDPTADADLAAKRLAFGKYINAGQTCVAPDYVLVHASQKPALLAGLKKWIAEFYPKGPDGVIENYPRIVNQKHFERLTALMEGEALAVGGGRNPERLSIDPAVLSDCAFDHPVMQEEIFGPLLPILTYTDADEMIAALRERPRPLALYLFSNDAAFQRRVLRELSFGGGCVNDVMLQVATSHLAFGGVGDSGMGSYHGEASFNTFTHFKSIVEKGVWPDIDIRYRPYTPAKMKWLRLGGKF